MLNFENERVGWHTERVNRTRKKRRIDLTYYFPVDVIDTIRL